MKKILILGGTQFIGKNLVEKLLCNSEYELTLFNRQQTQADLFPELKKIKGDRETDDILQFSKISWDYVIDLSCYFPLSLSKTLKSFIEKPKKYILVSSCSVYDNTNNHSTVRNEEAEILKRNKAEGEDKSDETYGKRKSECERVLKASELNYTILRPALVYGKYDPSDRLYYWLHEVQTQEYLLFP